MGQSISPSENYLFLNVMVNFVIVNQKLTGSALHIEKNQFIPNIKALAQTLFEISCIQDFKILFSKGHNSKKGHNSDMKKYGSTIFS